MDYIDKPEQRDNIRMETKRSINRPFRSAMLNGLCKDDLQALAARHNNSPEMG